MLFKTVRKTFELPKVHIKASLKQSVSSYKQITGSRENYSQNISDKL